jgi:hypothetical protein
LANVNFYFLAGFLFGARAEGLFTPSNSTSMLSVKMDGLIVPRGNQTPSVLGERGDGNASRGCSMGSTGSDIRIRIVDESARV